MTIAYSTRMKVTTNKHTPGPWAIYVPDAGQDGYPHNWNIGHDSENRSVYVASIPGAVHSERAQADARLIKAAPDLLEVTSGFRTKLATYCGVFPGDKGLQMLLKECDDVIAKVTGEKP